MCHDFIARVGTRQLRPCPPSLSASSFQPPRALHSSQKNPSYYQWLRHSHRALPQGILFWVLLTGAGVSYSFYNAKPLVLESDETYKLLGSEETKQKYLSPLSAFTVEQANEALRRDEDSHMVGTGSGVLRYDTMQLPSNPISEDDYLSASGHEEGEIKWMLFGIYDGHAGWETAAALREYLFPYIAYELEAISSTGAPSDATPQDIDQAIKKAFLKLDKEIMDQGAAAITGPSYLNEAMSRLGPAYSGSCALVSYYHSESQLLKVACTGDSRAVLGRRNAAGEWEAIALSNDQTDYNKDEIARLQKEHPDEPELVKGGRVLGLAVSRAFGDGRWKWSRQVQEEAQRRFFGPRLREPLISPPYLTALPEVTTTKIEPENGDFLIMASDGLWDHLTSAQAVDLVGRWLKTNDVAKESPAPDLAQASNAIPVHEMLNRRNPNPNMAYTDIQAADEKQFVVIDDNAATHLTRNALGGGNEDILCGLLTVSPPYSRNIRDDITVNVIFFGMDDTIIQNL